MRSNDNGSSPVVKLSEGILVIFQPAIAEKRVLDGRIYRRMCDIFSNNSGGFESCRHKPNKAGRAVWTWKQKLN